MGVGKTTVGTALAHANDVAYIDSDDDIERLFGATGGELADRWGIDALHQIEAGLLLGALASTTQSVITAAASVVENEAVRAALKRRATVAWLRGDLEETLRRQRLGTHRRTMSLDELQQLEQRRAPLFAEVSDIELDANLPTPALVELVDGRFPTERTNQ